LGYVNSATCGNYESKEKDKPEEVTEDFPVSVACRLRGDVAEFDMKDGGRLCIPRRNILNIREYNAGEINGICVCLTDDYGDAHTLGGSYEAACLEAFGMEKIRE
jgi:hypothetical protein